jgi:hypothetical protein
MAVANAAPCESARTRGARMQAEFSTERRANAGAAHDYAKLLR